MDTYTIEGAVPAQLDVLMEFYATDERESLPTPSYDTLRKALDGQSFLVALDQTGGIAATAAYFEYGAEIGDHAIYELAGTRVKNTIGRLKEIRLQQILLSLRIVIVAVTEAETGPLSLISSAKHTSSIDNLRAVEMEEIVPLPKWFEFDIRSWTQMKDRQDWAHFAANSPTLGNAIELLHRIDFVRGEYVCTTSRKQADGTYLEFPIKIIFKMGLVALFPEILRAHQEGRLQAAFLALPDIP
jgi:hypothetical protein